METKQSVKMWVVAVAVTAMCALVTMPAYATTLYDDAVSYWKFDTAGSPTLDSGTGGNSGTVNDATWTSSGKVGGAYAFDGTTTNISLQEDFYPLANFSISAWFKTSYDGGNHQTIISKQEGSDNEWQLIIHADAWGVPYAIYAETNAGSCFMQSSAQNLNDGAWHHLVVQADRSVNIAPNVYVDGILSNGPNSAVADSDFPDTSATMMIGYQGRDIYPFDGEIDEVAVWNRALGSNEIDALYKAGYISDAMSALSLSYTTDQINQLAYLYLNQTGPVTIGDSVWSYVAHDDPIWDGHRTVGATFNVGGYNYLYLGGGISQGGPLGGGVPEPSSMAVSGLAIGLLGLIKRFCRKKT